MTLISGISRAMSMSLPSMVFRHKKNYADDIITHYFYQHVLSCATDPVFLRRFPLKWVLFCGDQIMEMIALLDGYRKSLSHVLHPPLISLGG